MASFVFTNAKRALMAAEIDLHTGGDDIRALLVMTNTTADTEEDVATISAFTTLDEMDGSGYARQALGSEVVAADNTNNRGEFDAGDVTFASVGAGTRQVAAILIYKHVTNDSDSIPLFYIDSGGFPFAAAGGNIQVAWNAEGVAQLT